MARIARSPLAAISCALLVGCSSADRTQDLPNQAESGAGAPAAGASGASGQRSAAAGSGGATTGSAGRAAGSGGNTAGAAGQARAGHGGNPAAGQSGSQAGAAAAGAEAASPANVSRAMIEPDTAPDVSDADYAGFIAHLNQFGLDLGQKQQLTSQNHVYSPLSASYALAMTYAGARGKTAEEMQKVLGDTFGPGVFHKSANKLARELASRVHTRKDGQGLTYEIELSLADALFVDSTLTLGQSFLETMARDYDSGVHREDFIHAFEPARKDINGWVAAQTHDRIMDLLPEGALNDSTRVVLVNALYFYGSWQSPFSANATSDAPFHTLAGSAVQAKTMHNELSLKYAKGSDYALVELPYDNNLLRMTVVLPAEGKFESVRAQVSATWLEQALSSAASKTVNLALPKWKLTTASFSLKSGLEELGMKTAFSDAADLSGISQDGPLALSDVLQKAFIAVDEAGTEAAAATAVTVTATSLPLEIIPFTVDRPFLFFIRDQNGLVLFSGHVVDPTLSP